MKKYSASAQLMALGMGVLFGLLLARGLASLAGWI